MVNRYSLKQYLFLAAASRVRVVDSAAVPLRSVLVYRHCVRSCKDTLVGAPGFDYLNNYSAQAFAPWPVADYECLPEGITLVESAGTQLGPTLPRPLLFDVDSNAKRDNDTAAALLRGMGLPETDYMAAPCLFSPHGCGYCETMDSSVQTAAIETRSESFPPPAGLESLLESLQGVLGTGAAPPLEDIPDSIDPVTGAFTGGTSAAHSVAEDFLMQLGGNLSVAWDSVEPSQVYDFLAAHIYYRGVADRTLPIAAYYHSYIATEILDFLEHGSGTLVLVGHDTQQDALAELFGISWTTSPFPPNATTPGSALRLDMLDDGSTVAASVHYQSFDGSSEVLTAPAEFTWAGPSTEASFETFQAWAVPRMSSVCVPGS